jgi:hypothetical protein
MVLSWILQWWKFDDVSSSMRLGGAGARRRLLASVVAGNPRNQFVFVDLLGIYLQCFQDNHFCRFVY